MRDSLISDEEAMATAVGNKCVPLLQALDRGQIDGVVHQLFVLLGLDHAPTHVQHARLQALIQAISKLQDAAQLQARALVPGLCEGNTGCLSYSQLQMFTLQQLKPTSTAYNVVRAVRITNAPLRMEVLQATCDALLMKHDVLRTCFRSNWRGDPQQTVHHLEHFKNERSVKVVEFHEHRNDASLSKFIADVLNHPFDLENDLPVRFFVIPSHDEAESNLNAITSWVLVVVMHHIVTDAASSVIFWQDLAQLYKKFSEQSFDPGECLMTVQQKSGEDVSYRDYSLWQRDRLAGGILATSLDYWMQHLSGDLSKLDLPVDYNSHSHLPETEEQAGDVVIFQSSSALQKRFTAFCKSHGATIFMGLLSIFHLLLSRLAHSDDIVIGTPVSGRIQEAVETVMGYFVNTLPFRIQSKCDESFDQFFNTVREVVLNGLTHMEIPLQTIIEHLPLLRRESEAENPLFNVMFAWETNNNSSSAANEHDHQERILFQEITLPNQAAKFDLMLSMRLACNEEGDTVLEGSMVYDTNVFHRRSIDRFAQYFLILLENCMNYPSTKLSDLSMLPTNEQKQLVHQWGSPSASTKDFPTAYYQEMFIDECVQSQVASTPNNIAVQWEGADWSYQELWAQSARVAFILDRICSSKADSDQLRVGIYLDRGLTNVAAILGALRVKAVFVPLDTAFPIDRIQYMVADSQAHVLISQRSHADQIEQLLSGKYENELQVQVLFWEDLVDVTEANLCADISQLKKGVLPDATETIAYLLYTSGSTGKPKGVMVSHANLLTTLRWTVRQYNLTPNDVFLQSTSCTLDGSLTQLFSPLLVGAQALITKTNGLHDLEYIQELLLLKGVTLCVFVPSYFAMLIEYMPKFPRSVRYVILAGESLSMALAQKFYTKHFAFAGSISEGEHVPCLVNEYGPTEASVTSTFYRLPRSLALSELDYRSRASNATSIAALQSVPIGKPIDDHLVLVLDAKKRLVPVNVPGELYIGGRGVAKGYWKQPNLTAERFKHPESSTGLFPAESELIWYKSGDLVKWLPSGDLLFVGRTDSQVKLNGMRIELQEIQNVLLRHDSVQDAEVLVQNNQRLVGYVILNNQTTTNSALQLRVFLNKRLPPHMVPQEIRIIQEWPRTPNGKLDVQALENSPNGTSRCDQESHGEDSALITKHEVKPSKSADYAVESVQVLMVVNVLKLAWMEVLDLPDDASLYSSSFFELGGNSLSAIRVISLIKNHGLSLKLESFFRCVSLVDMARAASSIMGVSNLQTLVPLNYSRDLRKHQLNGANQNGDANSNTGNGPLFLVHDAEGTVWKLLELGRLLPFHVIGVQSDGATSESSQPDSVELLAEKYWHAIQSMQTQGPYSLGGFSFGCRVAHAIARLAWEQGHEVNPLVLIDGLPVTLQVPLLNAPFDPTSFHDNITEEYQSKRTASATVQSHEHYAETEFLDHVAAQFVAHCAMDVKYQPYDYNAISKCDRKPWLRCHLFKTEWWEVPIERFSAWGITMELHQVPGTHSTLLQRPNVQSLAQSILEHTSA